MPSSFDRLALPIGRSVIVIASILTPLLLAEVAARLTFEPTPPRRVYDPFAYKIPHPGLVDTFMGIEGESVTVRLNELGMLATSMATPVADRTRTLVFLGGSTTENYGFRREQTFPALVGEQLTKRLGTPIRVLNAGASGATTGVTLGRLQHQVVDLKPDLVVVMHAINDFLGGFEPGYRPDSRHLQRPLLPSRKPRSVLRAWARSLRPTRPPSWPIPTRQQTIANFDPFPARQAFARNLRSIIAVAHAHDLPIVLMTQPTMYEADPKRDARERYWLANGMDARGITSPDPSSLTRGMVAFNDTTRAIAQAMHVPLVDLAAQMPKSWDLFLDECHYTVAGNQRMATLLVRKLEETLRVASESTGESLDQSFDNLDP